MNFVAENGRDSFGAWVMQITLSRGATRGHFTCNVCGSPTTSRLHYWKPVLPMEISVENTILKRPQAWIGVSCGCYAKFIRQVMHIAEAGLRKGYSV